MEKGGGWCAAAFDQIQRVQCFLLHMLPHHHVSVAALSPNDRG